MLKTLKTLNTINEPRRQVEKNIEEALNKKLTNNNNIPDNRNHYTNNNISRSLPASYRKIPFKPYSSPLRSTCFRTTTAPSISFLPGKNDEYVKKLLSSCKTCHTVTDRSPKLKSRSSKRDIIYSKKHSKKDNDHSKKHHHHHRESNRHKRSSLLQKTETPGYSVYDNNLSVIEPEGRELEHISDTLLDQISHKSATAVSNMPIVVGENLSILPTVLTVTYYEKPITIPNNVAIPTMTPPLSDCEAVSDEETGIFEDLVEGFLPPGYMD